MPVPEFFLLPCLFYYISLSQCVFMENLKTSFGFHILLHLYFLGTTVILFNRNINTTLVLWLDCSFCLRRNIYRLFLPIMFKITLLCSVSSCLLPQPNYFTLVCLHIVSLLKQLYMLASTFSEQDAVSNINNIWNLLNNDTVIGTCRHDFILSWQ